MYTGALSCQKETKEAKVIFSSEVKSEHDNLPTYHCIRKADPFQCDCAMYCSMASTLVIKCGVAVTMGSRAITPLPA